MENPLDKPEIAHDHDVGFVLKSRSTGKFLAMSDDQLILVSRQEEAQRFCACHAPEIASVASKKFNMGFRVLEVMA